MSIAAVGAIAVSTVTFFVGHSGAEATWANKIQIVEPSAAPAEGSGDTKSFSMEEVAKHNTPEDCWSAVDGKVLDLTSYIDKHPGGAGFIKLLCGQDGTKAFLGEHSGQQTPMSQLEALVIGTLSEPAPAETATEEPSASGTGTSAALTAVEVAKHSTATDCWSVVSGNVYDLTGYATSHPGGASAINGLCGKDATSAFQGQHSGQQRPESTLAAFLIGPLEGGTKASTLPGATVTGGEENEHEDGRDGDDD